MNFISYIQLYQMTNDQAINILPFFFTEPVKHWFHQLQLTRRDSLTNFMQAFFARYRKTEEDLDVVNIKQGINEDLYSFIFSIQQTASALTITVGSNQKGCLWTTARTSGPWLHAQTEDNGGTTPGSKAGGTCSQHVEPDGRRHHGHHPSICQCCYGLHATAADACSSDGTKPSNRVPNPSTLTKATTACAESTRQQERECVCVL